MIATHVRWAGDRSLLLEFESLQQAMSAHGRLLESPVFGQLDAIAGARTVLVRLSNHTAALRARSTLRSTEFPHRPPTHSNEVVIDVAYDGPDLSDAAAFLDMSPEALIAWHTSQSWLGAFPGFAGFTYCVTQGPSLLMPRRTSPRTSVPGGSVALAGEFSGVYPRRAPGGWQLIGRTDAVMWDLSRETPSLIQPWDTVTYRQVRPEAIVTSADGASGHPSPNPIGSTRRAAVAAVPSSGAGPTAAPAFAATNEGSPYDSAGREVLTVLSTGLQSLIQDFGREGAASLGAGPSGVMDREAARLANDAVGNRSDAPVVENLFGGFSARALHTCVLAVTGAESNIAVVPAEGAARSVSHGEAFVLLAGDTVTVGPPHQGARSVIAVRGGIWAHPVLGSVSTDTHIKIGPPPISVGDTIRVGSAIAGGVQSSAATARRAPSKAQPDSPTATEMTTTLRVVFGPRDFWFSAEEQHRFTAQRWIVSPDSNRIGIRLGIDPRDPAARPIERARSGELLSEGMALGSLQIPPSGLPVLLANDQGITGGYPIIAVVLAQDLHLAAQLAPGSAVRFSAVDSESLTPVSHEPAPTVPQSIPVQAPEKASKNAPAKTPGGHEL